MKIKILLYLLIVIITFLNIKLFAQKKPPSIQFSLGKSWHGTGDLTGVAADILYEKNLSKRLFFSNGLTTTIHSGKDKGFNSLLPGTSPDNRLMRFTTAGLQLTSLLHYTLLSFPNQKFRIDGGGVLRFQSTSFPEQYNYVQNTNIYPEPFYVIYVPGKQNTFSAGYSFGLSYIVTVSSKYEVGIKALFQNDTNSDAITQISFIIGRFLNILK